LWLSDNWFSCKFAGSNQKGFMQNKKQFKRYTVTSALTYANGPLHIGHLAGVYVPADLYVRYLRSNEKDVVFIGGSDEHGVPITIKAWQQYVNDAGYVRLSESKIETEMQKIK
jgi:methionyl-tRNA synthetase